MINTLFRSWKTTLYCVRAHKYYHGIRQTNGSSDYFRSSAEVGFDDSWSDDEEIEASAAKMTKPSSKTGEATQSTAANDGTATLGIRLKELIQALGEDDAASASESSTSDDENADVKGKGKASTHKGNGAKVKKPKDNDSYYFDSYAANGESRMKKEGQHY
jgi:hypothetical protein